MSEPAVCPCEVFVHPRVIVNPSGQAALAYRAGDYGSFRHALLLAPAPAAGFPTETELTAWRPNARGDLALQMLEWWAYLADILTFYNEQIAGETYLHTAQQPASVRRIIRLLGYRPRPGIAATGWVAALVSGSAAFTLPRGFPIQSKPGPGKQPQIFETDADTLLQPLDVAAADVPPLTALSVKDAGGQERGLLVKGSVVFKPDDALLLLENGWNGQNAHWQRLTVARAFPEKDARGRTNTRVQFKEALSLPTTARVADYRLLKSTQSAQVWQYPAKDVITSTQVDLNAIVRSIHVGDPVLFDFPNAPTTSVLASVTASSEAVWYANPKPASSSAPDPTVPPDAGTVAIPIPHTRLVSSTGSVGDSATVRQSVVVRHGWQPVGNLIATPAPRADATSKTLQPAISSDGSPSPAFPSLPASHRVLVEDVHENGALGVVDTASALRLLDPVPALVPPLRTLFNTVAVSRGQTVSEEVLGSGDATIPGQEFVLQNAPLTYLLDPASATGENYRSTLRVWVNGVEWHEARSFYEQPPTATIFITREDEDNKTYVQFGDGRQGRRLPSGVNNVVASYRYGSGKDAPDTGTLTTILNPLPHLKEIRNPVPVGGGADPDPPDQIRRYAPRSVLTFGRAVSADDYETLAAQTPGVARARSYWTFDAAEGRSMVKIYVGDDAVAVTAARTALAGVGDPNRPLRVQAATPVPLALLLSVEIHPDYVPAQVVAAVRDALLSPETGLFGSAAVQIGQTVFRSEIYAACLKVPGTRAVHSLFVVTLESGVTQLKTGYRFDPQEGGFFQLKADRLFVFPEASHAG